MGSMLCMVRTAGLPVPTFFSDDVLPLSFFLHGRSRFLLRGSWFRGIVAVIVLN